MLSQNFKAEFRKFIKKLSLLALSNIGAQIVSVVGFIFISRIYTTSSIGDYVTYLALVGILSILSTANYDQALYIEKRPRLLRKLIFLPLLCSMIFALLSGLILFLFDIRYAFYIAIAMLSAGILKTTISLNISKGRLLFTSLYLLVISPILPLLIILNGTYLSPGTESMIMINALASFFTSIVFFFISAKTQWNFRAFISWFSWLQLLLLSRRYKKFLGFGMTGELIGSSALRIPIFIANEYFSKHLAAYFGIVFRMAITPITLILGNVAQIFMHKVSYNRKNHLPSLDLFIKYVIGLSLFGFFECVVILLFGHDLIIWLLTDKYETVYILLVDMLPYIFMLTVITPLTSVLNIFEKQEYTFYNKISFFIASSACFGYGVYVQDFFIAVQSFSISMAVIYVVIFIEVIIILIRNKSQLLKSSFDTKSELL